MVGQVDVCFTLWVNSKAQQLLGFAVERPWWIFFFSLLAQAYRSLESSSCRGSISVTGGSFQSAYSLSHKSIQVAESHFGLASFQTFLSSSF